VTVSVVSFGGGVNSTAMLVGLHERGERPDAILFADTGAEWPETYHHVEALSRWCEVRGFPPITTVNNGDREDAPHSTLEEECLRNRTLPSLAFGFKGCSAKWKRQPMDRWVRAWGPAQRAWERGELVQRLIGIDAGEQHRSANIDGAGRWDFRRPLIEWGWARAECVDAIERAGLSVPRKSACWFCPATRKVEVLALASERCDLFARAVGVERNAAENLGVVKGLGRHWSWETLVAADRAQLKLFPDSVEEPCGCFDGEAE
jgi:hypothetical protein